MRVIVVRHHAIDDAGFIADAFRARGGELVVHQFPKGGPLPELDGVDHIVVLGAAWSVYEERISGWIGAELDWLRAADAAGIPVLGICFGAQALTAALGGQVEAAPRSEVGWTMVEALDPDLIEPGPGWSSTMTGACRRRGRGCSPAMSCACKRSPSGRTWPFSSTRKSTPLR